VARDGGISLSAILAVAIPLQLLCLPFNLFVRGMP
jgi:hypothetical protein